MKKLLSALLLAASVCSVLNGQALTTSPMIVTPGKVIRIYYDTHQDNNKGGLKDYSGDLYVHTGVTLKGGTTWYNVKGSWGNNSTQPKLTQKDTHLYELDITPDIATYYSLAATDTVTQIDLVFRSADGTKQSKPDIFLTVFQPGLRAYIIQPGKKALVAELNSTISVSSAASFNDSVTLYVNNKYIRSGSTADSVNYAFKANQYGGYWIKTVAWKIPDSASDSFFVYVRPPVTVQALPDGINDGINYTSPVSATLVLVAPYKQYAFVLGDFNGWRADSSGYMKVTPDGSRYWISLSGLTIGKEYRYQFLVDSTLIADPYCEKILDPDNDKYITAATYPGLISYPADTTTGIVSVLQTNQQPYNWKNTSFQAPARNKLVIYELLVRDFVATHSYKTLTDTLNYLKRLGVNAVELMPITEFEGNSSWGYNISFQFAPDKYYGTRNMLRAFVDSCHSRGIAVIMDMVLNHIFGTSPLVQLYLDHYATDQIVMKLPNPWFNSISPNTSYYWGADFNHAAPETQKLVDRITSHWLTDYHIDGFRFDFSKGFTNTPGDGYAYDASRIAILKRMADKIWSVNPNAYVILEHFTANTEEKELSDYGMMPWGNLNGSYTQAAEGFTSDLSWGTSLARGWTNPYLVTYMESHDEERLMFSTVNNGKTSPSYSTRLLATALKRMELCTVFFLTIPGPKMIWQFGELGYDISINYNGRVGEKPIRWSYYSSAARYRLFLIYKALNNLRKTQDVFSSSSYNYSLNGMQKSIQLTSANIDVNILGNFDITAASITPSFQKTGKWYEYFTGDSITVTGVNDQIGLQAGEYRLYTSVKLTPPEGLVGLEETRALSGSFTVAYPNPSSESVYFSIKGIQPSDLTISIFDISGRMISQVKGSLTSGDDVFRWDGTTTTGEKAGNGVYFARINAGKHSEVIRIIRN
ncbi:MAG TPA: alpha-amylase family glycosyl hydrolase [Bacteroidales bacterium]|nr:alpha-amylase family glycosyl hydrolase [Bacteroidales bacterium]